MYPRDAAGRKRSGGNVIFSFPTGPFHRDAAACQAINGGKREILCLAIVPAQANEKSGIPRDLLLEVEARAVLERSGTVHGGDIRRDSGLRGETEGIGITAGIGVVQISEQPHRAWTGSERVAVLAFENVAAIAQQAPVKSQPIRLSWLGNAAIAHRPVA